jgi:hypothetical protein
MKLHELVEAFDVNPSCTCFGFIHSAYFDAAPIITSPAPENRGVLMCPMQPEGTEGPEADGLESRDPNDG